MNFYCGIIPAPCSGFNRLVTLEIEYLRIQMMPQQINSTKRLSNKSTTGHLVIEKQRLLPNVALNNFNDMISLISRFKIA